MTIATKILYCCLWGLYLPSLHLNVASSFLISSPISNYCHRNDCVLTKQHQHQQKKVAWALNLAQYFNYNEDENAEENEEEEIDPERKRMEMVRMIQKTYYQSSSISTTANQEDDDDDINKEENAKDKIDKATGKIYSLPLWRVNWVETPGRANVLNVHELQYTHMFETILAENKPWYVGHLYTPGGSKGVQKGLSNLQSWSDNLAQKDDDGKKDEESSSKVIGTLLRITDYRRLEDGRLMILVHGLERFVVDQVQQDVPYATADVQLLPDLEISTTFLTDDEDEEKKELEWKNARRNAILQSIPYHQYECKNMELPLPQDCEYLPKNGLPLALIAKLLPFAFFDLEDESSLMNIPDATTKTYNSAGNELKDSDDAEELALEQQLINGGILQYPSSYKSSPQRETTMTEKSAELQKLETLIWLALDDLCINTNFKLPDEILCLMPTQLTYLHMEQPAQHLSTLYPSIRRQSRLSYLVPGLLEKLNTSAAPNEGNDVNDQRQMLLEIPSILARLKLVLEKLEGINDYMVGEFQ